MDREQTIQEIRSDDLQAVIDMVMSGRTDDLASMLAQADGYERQDDESLEDIAIGRGLIELEE